MSNIHQLHNMATRRSKQLCELFRRGGKSQLSTFEFLAVELEKLAIELRKNGLRSGSMQRAFGENYSRMAGRFLARQGKGPNTIYRTPAAWEEVIRGFAKELGRDPEGLIIDLLTASPLLDKADAKPSGNLQWVQVLEELLIPMTKHLTSSVDLAGISEFVARNGLYLDGDGLAVSEWPHGDGSISSAQLYNPIILTLIPHVFGINYHPITSDQLPLTADGILDAIGELAPSNTLSPVDLQNAAFLEIEEGMRTGIALVLRDETRKIEPALFQWNLGQLRILDESQKIIASLPMDVEPNLPEIFSATPGIAAAVSPEDSYKKPDDWLANSVRFHFLDSDDFERVAAELIVRPWAWGDPGVRDIFWSPAHYGEAEEFPTRCPFYTIAGAIEGNLLYAELHEGINGRLDTLLRHDIERIEKLVNEYSKKGERIELAARERLFADWGIPPKGADHGN